MMIRAMDSTHVMPGMLSAEQLATARSGARAGVRSSVFPAPHGSASRGRLRWWNELFATGGGRKEPVYKNGPPACSRSDDEIEAMQRMLAADFLCTLFQMDSYEIASHPSGHVAVVSLGACAAAGGSAGNNSTVAPNPDPRVGLRAD